MEKNTTSTPKAEEPSTTRWLVVLFTLLLLTRLPGLILGHGITYNSDEIGVAYASLDRLLGVPSTTLAWPAGPLLFLGLAKSCVGSLFSGLSLDSFATYLSRSYLSPWGTVTFLRLCNVLFFCAGMVALVGLLRREFGTSMAWAAGIFLVALNPTLLTYTHIGTGDAMAFGLCCLSISMLHSDRSWQWLAAGAFFGAALASKIIILLLAPFMVCLAWRRPTFRLGVSAVWIFAGVLLGFMLFCPWLWVEPLRLLKGILGNAMRKGSPMGLANISMTILVIFTPALLGVCLLGLWRLWAEGKRALFVGALLTWLPVLALFLRSGVVYDRYFLPLLPTCVFMTAAAFQWIFAKAKENKSLYKRAAVAVVVVCLIWDGLAYAKKESRIITYAQELRQLTQKLQAHKDKNLSLPWTSSVYFLPLISKSSFLRAAKEARHAMDKGIFLSFVKKSGVSVSTLRLLAANFNEDEQAFVKRVEAMAHAAPKDGWEVRFSSNPLVARRLGLDSSAKATSLYKEGKVAVLLLYHNSKASPKVPSVTFDTLFIKYFAKSP